MAQSGLLSCTSSVIEWVINAFKAVSIIVGIEKIGFSPCCVVWSLGVSYVMN